MPPKGSKSKHAPNQHDKRHENGLAPPGKRVTKQRSTGQLNGHLNGKPVSSVPPPQLPSTGLNQGLKFPRPTDNTTDLTLTAAQRDHATALEGPHPERTPSDTSVEELGHCSEMADSLHEHLPPSVAPAHQATAYKTGTSNGGSTFSAVSTVLTYYPLRDAISILILLLSLPSPLVLVIQTLFASLTFVPPTVGLSLSALPSLKDLFNSSNIAGPAIWTILIVDLGFGLVWMLVWKPVQSMLLDLSQAAIAVSLSGAAAGNSGPTYSIVTTSLIVCVVHVLRYKAIHLTALDYLRSVLHKANVGLQFDIAPHLSSFYSSPPIERGWLFTLIRTILGIHIVSQGVTTCIRRSLVKANERDQALPTTSKTDTEANVGSETSLRTSGSLADLHSQSHTVSSADGRHPGPSPSHRDSKSRESSKKKRKLANQVRGQQPLWAAIASTKVTFIKEVEQREAANDAREASAMDDNITTSHASTLSHNNRIWVSEVRDTGIIFSVDLSAGTGTAENGDDTADLALIAAGIDKSKPFYVRVNGATWGSTRIAELNSGDGASRTSSDQYVCDVFGLSPLTSYHCEIISITSQQVLCSARLITQPPSTAEQASFQPSQAQHPTLRPSSPITTLKQSIQSAETKLNDVRNRTKKTKKDQRAAHSDIKKEINSFKSKLESSGGIDDKQERRLLQINQHKNQAEEATAELKSQIEALGEIPEDDIVEHEAKRRAWQSALDARNAANGALEALKAEHDRELSAIKSELAVTESKKEKLAARIIQRTQELEKLAAKQQADLTAKQRREIERAQILEDRDKRESELRYHINKLEVEAQGYSQKASEAWQQVSSLSNWTSQSTSAYPGRSSPPTPDHLPSMSNGSLGQQANGLPGAYGPPPAYPPFFPSTSSSFNPSYATTNGGPRGRSSSMLSQISGFTDSGEEFNFTGAEPRHQHTWPMQSNTAVHGDRTASEGEGSGQGGSGSLTGSTNGSNSPRPEAKPFIPGGASAKPVGTIGPPGGKKSQSPTVASANAVGSGR